MCKCSTVANMTERKCVTCGEPATKITLEQWVNMRFRIGFNCDNCFEDNYDLRELLPIDRYVL
jgi:hypothetical protein